MRIVQRWLSIKSWIKYGERRKNRVRKHLDEIRRGESDIRRDREWIPLYFRYRQSDEPAPDTVDDRTWSDLEMDQVFTRIDRTVSVIGRQYLYAMLRIYKNGHSDNEIQRLNELYSIFGVDETLREKIQTALYPLRRDESAYLVTLFYEDLPTKSKWSWLIYLCSGLFFLSLALIALNPIFFFTAVVMAFCNILINAFYGSAIFRQCADLSCLTAMLNTARKLARIVPPAGVHELDELRSLKDFAAALNSKVFWFSLNDEQMDNLTAVLYGFLNHFGLARLVVFLRIDGQSYYSRELELLREFLNCTENRYLFLIDEIFRGTNTVERVAISAATLRYLTRNNMALVTTHDIELQPLLADCARLFHFSEQIDGDRYYFDFIVRNGPCHAGNAIKLIELKGYPSDIVTEARRLVGKYPG